MKGFLIKCVIFLVIFFALDKALIPFRNKLPEKELDKRLEQLINGEVQSDLVILGSSRSARGIVASQLQDSLHTTAFNLSYPGSNILFHEYLLDNLLLNKKHSPRLIILSVDDASALEDYALIEFRMDRLYPLVKYQQIREKLIDAGEKNEALSNLFIIHQLSITNFDLRKKHFSDVDTLLSDGSMPISWQHKKFEAKFGKRNVSYTSIKESPDKVRCFQRILAKCKERNIGVLIACPPNFGTPTKGFIERMQTLAGNNIPVYLFDTTNMVYQNPNYFFDNAHLKLNGATVFTSGISAYIKQNKLLN